MGIVHSTMLRLSLLACLCLQQLPLSQASDEVVLVSQAPPAQPSAAAALEVNLNGTLSPEQLAAAAALAGVNITFINGTAYEEYEMPDPASLSGINSSLAAGAFLESLSSVSSKPATQQPLIAADNSETVVAAAATAKAVDEAPTSPPVVHEESTTAETTSTQSTTLPTTMTTVTPSTQETTSTTTSGPATVKVELGRLSVYPVPPVVENSGAVELFCSAGYHDSASIVWTLNDEPLEDVVQRSVISGRKDFFLKSLRIQVDRLETLPAPAGKYIFECVASVDGNLLKERVELDSPYGNFCRNDSECSARNAVCGSALSCRCDGGHPVHLNSSHVTCRAAAHLGWPCSYDEQCTYAANNSHCGSKGECDCIESFKMETSPLGNVACAPRKTVSAPCTTDDDCKDIGAKCSAASSTCQCPAGTLESDGRCIGQPAAWAQGLNQSAALVGAVTGGEATNASSTTASAVFTANMSVVPSSLSDPRKHMPVRILKVREFPRGAPVKEHPNDTAADGRATHGLDGVVKVDLPMHENDTALGNQRMLTATGHRLMSTHKITVLFVALMLAAFGCVRIVLL